MKKSWFKRSVLFVLFSFFCVFAFGTSVTHPFLIKNLPAVSCSKSVSALPSLKTIIKKLFNKPDNTAEVNATKTYVYLGGIPLGLTISCSGVVVVAISNENSGDLKEGDIIYQVAGESVGSATEILSAINKKGYDGGEITVNFKRNEENKTTKITPIFDETIRRYKLGIWVRDNAAGVGTLTYIKKDDLRFGALGHPVCDIDTGSLLPASGGNIYKCNIVGCKRGTKGSAGELRGLFLRNGSVLGSLDTNSKFGIYGYFDENCIQSLDLEVAEVASRAEVKCGKATIRCTVDGTKPKDYEIEIVKTYFQSSEANKSMFIRVTDERLIQLTGGIVQGMSGSPIIQNGKLVGAVTHVFVSDPTKGYGIYADWLINN